MMMLIRQGQSIRGSVVAAASLFMFCILIPRVARADIVHLKNGRAMEGMILEESPEQVLLQLPFGEIGFPRASVLRIDRGTSTFEEYLDLRLELQRQDGTASEWLELARWAEQEGLDHSAREATLVAARLDPGLPGLVPAMTALGYEYEENLAVWLPHDEMMRRRGYVLSNGRWLSPSQAVAFKRAQEAAVAGELERQRQERLARAMEMLVLTQLAQAEESRRMREEAVVVRYGIPRWGGYPLIEAPGPRPRPPLRPEHHRQGYGSEARHTNSGARKSYRDAIVRRPPGSLIPVRPVESHRGGFQRPPDPQ